MKEEAIAVAPVAKQKANPFEKKLKLKTTPRPNWHGSMEYGSLSVTGLTTGCGLCQLYGVINYGTPESFIADFKRLLEQAIVSIPGSGNSDNSCTAFIATLGNTSYHYEKNLLKAGFKRIAEYKNGAHWYSKPALPTDTQRLYIYDHFSQ